ncbi:hypothetical protein, partial [Actinophytocola sp.]|uniref:hypothetical protein n=1 Tax=Actinophytocola sp. TaxID=1872138 RepID=UPI00389AAE7C
MIGGWAGRLVHGRLAGEVGLAAAVAVTGLLLAGGEVAIYLSHATPVVRRSMAQVELWQYVLQGSSMVITGFLVLAHRVARVLGWLLLGAAVVFMVAACLSTWLRFTTEVTPLVRVAVYGEYALWEVPRVVFVLIPLFFPTGRLPGRWARPLVVGLPVGILAVEASALLGFQWWHPGGVPMPNALYSARWATIQPAAQRPLELLVWFGIVVVTVSPILRWRGSDRLARRQIAIAVSVFVLFLVEEGLRHLFFWSWWVAAAKLVVAVVWPAIIGYVVIRDRLYELDLAARRIIAGVVPVVLLAVVYMAAAVTMSLAVPRDGAALAAVLAVLAALVGLVLRPISGWVVARVDRLLYGDRAEPYQLARRLAGQLRDGVGPAQTPVAVCQIVVSALRLPGAALDVTVVQPPRRVAEVGELGAELESFDLRYHGKLVGRLLVPPRPGQSRLDDLDRIVLQPLADLAAPAVSALWLQEELATSRVQLVSAREDERRRLRQDVHDGLGPSLAAIRLRV